MQCGYEFDLGYWGLLTPFFRIDWADGNDNYKLDGAAQTLYLYGINWKVNSNLVLKAEFIDVRFRDVHQRDFTMFYTSVVFSF